MNALNEFIFIYSVSSVSLKQKHPSYTKAISNKKNPYKQLEIRALILKRGGKIQEERGGRGVRSRNLHEG